MTQVPGAHVLSGRAPGMRQEDFASLLEWVTRSNSPTTTSVGSRICDARSDGSN